MSKAKETMTQDFEVIRINTFQCVEDRLFLGVETFDNDFNRIDSFIEFDSYEFLQWIDSEKIEYIKDQLIKHINKK